jgi:3-phosphoshikimate 1-carboxyvinyltransferase
MEFKIASGNGLKGIVNLPGDKSISHRSIMCAALAEGETLINGFLRGEDCLATLNAFQQMGVDIQQDGDKIKVHGVGLHGLQKPKTDIYLGNSGTSMRLMSGLLAGQNFCSTLTGDLSLSTRPMMRIVEPLALMGANIQTNSSGTSPLEIQPTNRLLPITYSLPVASAQVKSCLMFAALYADGPVVIKETVQTRNHTELMFKKFGIQVEIESLSDTREIKIFPKAYISATEINIPADFSSAAFLILAALITPDSDLTLRNVGLNPSRTALLGVLKEMGADISISNSSDDYEPCGDLTIKSSRLKGISLNPLLIPNLIDELPVLFVAAALAEGKTSITGAAELRAKESDRLEAMASSLEKLGVTFKLFEDAIDIQGLNQNFYTSNASLPFKSAVINSFGDHRIAMASAVACTRAEGESVIQDTQNVVTSFPNFLDVSNKIGLDIRNN